MTPEEQLRATWEWVKTRPANPYEGYTEGTHVVEIPGHRFSDPVESVAVKRAFDFTLFLKRKIAEMEESVTAVEFAIKYGDCGQIDCGCVEPLKRTLAREQAALAELKRGLK